MSGWTTVTLDDRLRESVEQMVGVIDRARTRLRDLEAKAGDGSLVLRTMYDAQVAANADLNAKLAALEKEHEDYARQINGLTRERDEARQLIDGYRKVAERYEASAASPEVMRVVEASLAEWERVKKLCGRSEHDEHDAWREWWDANDALSASRQPKARFRAVLHCGYWEVREYAENDVVIPRVMRLTQPQAERIADILNAEAK